MAADRVEQAPIGRHVGPYRIEALLGRGGMGEVYRAKDTRLGRDVAVKILPSRFLSDAARIARFGLEARLLASLNHPNIATIHSFEDFDGSYALVMELIGGQTLAERLTSGALPVDEVLRVATQIAEALAAAHRNGILHRDIKPANVKITSEGRVKVLDFGLGKATLEWERDHSTETMPTAFTQAGFIVGTPAYMSPEQIRGQAVDTRADVWAFGCLVYELLTGRRPFEGDTVVEIAAAVLRADPDWTLLPAATPSAARALLKSCLEKNLQARLSDLTTARSHLEGALREGVAGSKTERTPMSSVVVLPFANVSGDPEMDYLSDGLTESIITSLSQVAGLRVMSRTAVVRYKGRAHQAQDIGRELGVAAVLTGSVLQRNDMLVITTELVDVDRGWQLWGGQYKRPRKAIFETEDEIAKEIVEKLLPTLTAGTTAVKRYTDNVEAYHLYLRGRFYWAKRTEQGLKKAIQYFRQAIELDPTYALAHAGVAEGYVPLGVYCHLAPTDAFPKARAAAEMALEIDPQLAEARTVIGSYQASYDWNLAGAEEEVRAALAANPKYSRAWQVLAEIHAVTNRIAEAEAEAKHALQLDPLALSLNAFMAMNYLFSRRYDEAIEYGCRTVDMDPSFFPGYFYLGLAYQLRGRCDEAVTTLQQGRLVAADSTLMIASLGGAYAAQGNRVEALSIARELDEIGRGKYVSQVFVAAIHLGLGDDGHALACLERAYAERCYWLLRAVTVDARFDRLRSEPQLHDLRRRMGLIRQSGGA